MPLMPTAMVQTYDTLDGWTPVTAETWTYASATTFTVPTDLTVRFSKGTRIKLTNNTVKYFVVTTSSFGGGNTTVTITGGTDYTLANAAITATFYSYAANPQGYPTYFNYTPTYTGFSVDPSVGTGVCYFSVIGSILSFVHHPNANGTSNATGFTLTVPVASLDYEYDLGWATNNGASQSFPCLIEIPGSTTANVYRDGTIATWTNTGAKNATFRTAYRF